MREYKINFTSKFDLINLKCSYIFLFKLLKILN